MAEGAEGCDARKGRERLMAGDLRGNDYIDSRDVIKRITELEEVLEQDTPKLECECAERRDDDDRPVKPEISTCGTCDFKWCSRCEPCPSARTPCEVIHEEWEELQELKELEQECNYGDWSYGVTLIRDDKFEDYARDLADDIGGVKEGWPFDYIDWERACDALKMDYSSVEFAGYTYWVRS
jgi:hypothetical protein